MISQPYFRTSDLELCRPVVSSQARRTRGLSTVQFLHGCSHEVPIEGVDRSIATPDFKWFADTLDGKCGGYLTGTDPRNIGTGEFSIFRSLYLDDAAFLASFDQTRSRESHKTHRNALSKVFAHSSHGHEGCQWGGTEEVEDHIHAHSP